MYGTTRHFLEHFGLRSVEDLPRPEELPVVLRERIPLGPEELGPEPEAEHEADEPEHEADEPEHEADEPEPGADEPEPTRSADRSAAG
jgi:hypothetical protein